MNFDEFNQLFETFNSSLFRLEQLPVYRTGSEEEPLKLWREHGNPPKSVSSTPWQSDLRRWKSEGKTMERVRAIRSPLSDYLRMSIEWWYPHNIAAGEKTLALDLDRHDFQLPENDFWMFDESIVVLMHYKPDGTFVKPELLDDSEVPHYRQMRHLILGKAENLNDVYLRLLALA